MEALHRGGGGGLDAQKENLDANFVGGALGPKGGLGKASGTPSTKRAALKAHSDAKPGRKGLKDSAKKNRRALGDISNRHVNRHEDAGGVEDATAVKKSAGLGRVGLQVKTPSGKHKTREATPAKAALAVQPSSDDVEEVEAAYGGLASPLSDAHHMKRIREDMAREIRSDKTPTFFDNLDLPDPLAGWDSKAEHEMLESGAAPSAWWAPPSPLRSEEAAVDIAAYDDVPPPDDFALDSLDPLDDDVLDLALDADLDASTPKEAA